MADEAQSGNAAEAAQPQEQAPQQAPQQAEAAPAPELSLEEQLLLYSVDEDGQPAYQLTDDVDWDPARVVQGEQDGAADAVELADEEIDALLDEEESVFEAERAALQGQLEEAHSNQRNLVATLQGLYGQLSEMSRRLEGPERLAQEITSEVDQSKLPQPGTPEWHAAVMQEMRKEFQDEIGKVRSDLAQSRQSRETEKLRAEVLGAMEQHPDFPQALAHLSNYVAHSNSVAGLPVDQMSVLNRIGDIYRENGRAWGSFGEWAYAAAHEAGYQPPEQQVEQPQIQAQPQIQTMMDGSPGAPPDGGRPPDAEIPIEEAAQLTGSEARDYWTRLGDGNWELGFQRHMARMGGVVEGSF